MRVRVLARSIATVLLCAGTYVAVGGSAGAADVPVEPFAGYEPQTVCSPVAKPGTKALGQWVVASYGGRAGAIGRACAGSSKSEHKEGRAFDWSLSARSAADRARAARFLQRITATGPTGEQAELARRMGVMYLIWNDRIYAAYDEFRARPYRSSSCKNMKKLKKCSMTLRHRDHMHISLTRAGGMGRTSWYVGRVPAPPPS